MRPLFIYKLTSNICYIYKYEKVYIYFSTRMCHDVYNRCF